MSLTNENIVHISGKNIEYLQFKCLLKYQNILTHAYTLKDSKINYGPNISLTEYSKNFNILCQELNLDVHNLIKPQQEHTSTIKIITKKDSSNLEINPDYLYQTDALITNQPNIILATTNADCILFLLFDPVHKVIANVHSGWRGTLQEIVLKTTLKMHEEFNCQYQDIICCICPAIHKCHFEVGTDVKELFVNKFKDLSNFNQIIISKNSKYHIDTILLNKTLLEQLGLKSENIIDSNICSLCHPDQINSYRFDKSTYKLSTAIISLK